jgi:superfamily II DNA or RNA helicase
MGLRKYKIKNEYRLLIDNIVQDFYVPLLSEATSYKRAVGFFSSSALTEITKGIAEMALDGGKIELVASPYLSNEDINAIRRGYDDRNKIIENALIKQLKNDTTNYFSMERLNLLASLIADGVMDIEIAYTENDAGIGMYHEKMGIIEDITGDKVVFSGSNNETATAMSINYETMDVFKSWGDESEKERVQLKENAFYSIWHNLEPNIKVARFPNVTDALIEKYKRKKPNYQIDKIQFNKEMLTDTTVLNKPKISLPIGARIPDDIKLRDYQKEAISAWVGENYRGIFDMATGTGKTFTGLGAVAKLSENLDDILAVVIVCPYQHLVEQWVGDIIRFNIKPIIGYSTSPQKEWKKKLARAVRDQKIRREKSFFCLVCTNATFASLFVQKEIGKIAAPILLVVDEAHNFGAPRYMKLLDKRFTYRLALSATLDRYQDDEGTAFLYNFFGEKCINYSLSKAIKEDKLTRYKYYPCIVYLTAEELEQYEQLSYEISRCLIKGRDGECRLNYRGKILAIQRARIIAGANGKLDKLREVIVPYVHENNILVYCGATNVIDNNIDDFDSNESDIRQIEAVTQILGNEFHMKVAKFTAEENIETRTIIKNQFQRGNQLQVIVAIKCLDEGVNIPGIHTAFILASTTNPKEYIQRRGRVLRKARNKSFAEIYDFVTLPRELCSVSGLTADQARRDLGLVKNELIRIKEFGQLAMNPMEANDLIWNIQETYHIFDEDISNGKERSDYGI